MCACPFCRECYEVLQIFDCAVDEDAFGVVAGCVSGEEGIGAGCQDEDVVRDCFARGGRDCFLIGMYLGDFGVEVVIEGAFWDGGILFEQR